MPRSLMLPLGALALMTPAPVAAQTLLDVINSLTSLDARVTLQAGSITLIDGQVTTNTQAITQLEADRTNLLDRLAVIDSAAAAVATNLQAQQQTLAALAGQVQASVAAGDALTVNVQAQGSAIGALNTQLGATANLVTQQGARIDIVNQVALAAQDAVVTLRGDVDAGRTGMIRQLDPNGAISIAAQSGGTSVSFIPGRGMVGASIGGSRGQTAFAMGLSKAFMGENAPVIRAGAAVDTRRGDFSYNASVGIHF